MFEYYENILNEFSNVIVVIKKFFTQKRKHL